ncbi:MAG: PEGA domain-containing protein [Deltaproteobacteria bacterium]|nr:PEGA domain-containing protein [Deltaproteobacteria bacterium]
MNRPIARGACLLALLLLPQTALSQRTPQATAPVVAPVISPEEMQARTTFERGIEALNDSQFATAASAFEESFRLNPVPVVLFNLAFAYRGLGRHLDAVSTLDRFLANPGNTPEERQQDARTEQARLRASIVRLTVRCAPEDCLVRVDGHEPSRENGAMLLDPGRHGIDVSREGYRPQHLEMNFESGAQTALPITLAIIDDAGRLRIEPSVLEASVSIDGRMRGVGIVEQRVNMGMHHIEVSAPGHVTLRRDVRVGGTGLVRVEAVMQRTRSNPWVWLGPVIGGVSAAAVGLAIWGVADATRGEIGPMPTNCLNCATTSMRTP